MVIVVEQENLVGESNRLWLESNYVKSLSFIFGFMLSRRHTIYIVFDGNDRRSFTLLLLSQ